MIRTETTVKWNWGAGYATGDVAEKHTDRVQRRAGGSTITRNGSEDDPALVITPHKGDHTVLKLQSEVERAD